MIPDFTVMVAVDINTIEHLKVSALSWMKYHPELFDRQWLVVYDSMSIQGVDASEIISVCKSIGVKQLTRTTLVSDIKYESQRERMLTAHVFGTEMVTTPYVFKLDVDSVCMSRHEWPAPEWFDGEPDVIAQRWGYSKAKGGGGTIREWCEKLESWGDKWSARPRLGLADHISAGGNKILMRRFCSWHAFYKTAFCNKVSHACRVFVGSRKLPVPSEDTVRWYYAQRAGLTVKHIKPKRIGWTNVSRLDQLKVEVERACQG